MPKFTGGCACGAVRYEIAAEPLFQFQCHCRKCQQLSGTGHADVMAFPKAAMTLTGTLGSWSYTADSGNTATRRFCPKCSSQIAGGNNTFPDIVGIQVGSLDDASSFKPQMTVFSTCAHPWDRTAEGLPSFPGMPPM